MTRHDFERNFEIELEEEWQEVQGDFFNWNSFVSHQWRKFHDDEDY